MALKWLTTAASLMLIISTTAAFSSSTPSPIEARYRLLSRETPTNQISNNTPEDHFATINIMPTENRLDVFVFPHTVFRAMLNDALLAAQKVFVLDDEECKRAMEQVKTAAFVYLEHGAGEDEYWGKPLAEKDAKLAAEWAADHANDDRLRKVDELADDIMAAPASERIDLLDVLYATFCEFISNNLAHMRYEETTIHEALWKHFTDEELLGMQGKMLQNCPPQYLQECGPLFLKYHGYRGRIEYMSLMKGLPPFDPLMGLLKTLVSETEYAHIEEALQ